MLVIYFMVALAVLFPVTLVTSYLISTLTGHVAADFPYISDTGTTAPESCVFGQMLNMAAVLFGILVYVRYLQVEKYASTFNLPKGVLNHNRVSIAAGMIAAVGVSIVANFQVSNVIVVHMIGAFLAFLSPIIYMSSETAISFCTSPMACPKWIAVVRAVITAIYIGSFVVTTVFENLAPVYFTGTNYQKWEPEDGGWEFHVVSATFEWLLGILIVVFLVSYAGEFRQAHVGHPDVKLVGHHSCGTMTSKSSDINLSGCHTVAVTPSDKNGEDEMLNGRRLKLDVI